MSSVRIYTIGQEDLTTTQGHVDLIDGEVYTEDSEFGKSTVGWVDSDGKVYKKTDEGKSLAGYVSGNGIYNTSEARIGEVIASESRIVSHSGGRGASYSKYTDRDVSMYAAGASLLLGLLIPHYEYVICPRCGSQVWSLRKYMDAHCDYCHHTFFKRGVK